MQAYEKYPVSPQLLNLWLQETILHEQGYIVVTNHGRCYAIVDEGAYSYKKQGITKQGTADKEEQLRIISELIKRYQNFERNGYQYHYSRGSWMRSKVKEKFCP